MTRYVCLTCAFGNADLRLRPGTPPLLGRDATKDEAAQHKRETGHFIAEEANLA